VDSAQDSRDDDEGCASAASRQPTTGQGNRRAFTIAARICG